ncbi:Na+/H+ antiporter NhaA [Salmonella enterica subsp. enterica serovar Weltevreden]|nr:Na+/H+ antiporter NhaA [Salmonella enterica subsp. enterica serovar Weltevreden]
MAVFPLIGPEVASELMQGLLASLAHVPFSGDCRHRRDDCTGIALIPAFNYSDPAHLASWAIPAATDIALRWARAGAVKQRRVPLALKIFLMTRWRSSMIRRHRYYRTVLYQLHLSIVSLGVAAFAIAVLRC